MTPRTALEIMCETGEVTLIEMKEAMQIRKPKTPLVEISSRLRGGEAGNAPSLTRPS